MSDPAYFFAVLCLTLGGGWLLTAWSIRVSAAFHRWNREHAEAARLRDRDRFIEAVLAHEEARWREWQAHLDTTPDLDDPFAATAAEIAALPETEETA